MPRNGGRCRKLWNDTAVAIVQPNRNMMRFAPRRIRTSPSSSSTSGVALSTKNAMITAGMT